MKHLFPGVLCLSLGLLLTGCGEGTTEEADPKEKTEETTSAVKDNAPKADETVSKPTVAAKDDSVDAGKSLVANGKGNEENASSAFGAKSDASTAGLASGKGAAPEVKINNSDDAASLAGIMSIEPAALDLGQIPTHDNKTGTVVLRNNGDTPIMLTQCKSSCGCTTANCPTGEFIEPGTERIVELRMKGGARAQTIKKRVTFIFDGHESIVLPVQGESVSFVDVLPATLLPEQMPEGQVTLQATDGEAFRILRMHPPIITEFTEEPQTSFQLALDWEKWTELGASRRATFYLDHPSCQQVVVNIRAQRENNNAGNVGNAAGAKTAGKAITPEMLIERGQTNELLAKINAGEVPVNYTDRSGANLLCLAAHKGHIGLVEALLDLGASIEGADKLGRTPLMWSAQSKNAEVVQTLLDAGADIRASDLAVGSALSWAAGFGDAGSVRALLDARSDVEIAGRMTGFTPLIWASSVGEAESVEMLIEAGAYLEATDLTPDGNTPLMHAAMTGRTDNVVALIDGGADLESLNRAKKTALLVAAGASGSTVETVRALIDAGASLDAVDERGNSALALAQRRTDPRGPLVVEYIESLTK